MEMIQAYHYQNDSGLLFRKSAIPANPKADPNPNPNPNPYLNANLDPNVSTVEQKSPKNP